MNIQFCDLFAQYSDCKKDIDAAIQYTIDNSDYILGVGVTKFEQEFSEYTNSRHAVGVSNGLDAIRLALQSLGITREVIVPAHTFIASVLPAIDLGIKVRLVDVNYSTMLLDETKLEEAITKDTEAIIPVHLYGGICKMNAIMDIINARFPIIEDCSQSQGAKQNGEMCGSWSDIACYSLYPAKNLGAFGDSGILTTNFIQHFDQIRKLRNYGSEKKYYHEVQGGNYRMDTLQARILSVKLKKLDEWNDRRQQIDSAYYTMLDGIGDLVMPFNIEGNYHVVHQFVIKTQRRDELQEYLKEKGVPTVIHYPIPLFRQKCFEGYDFGNKNHFPIAEQLAKEVLSLPMHPFLKNDEIEYICDSIKSFYSH